MKIKSLGTLSHEEDCHLIDLIMDFSREYNAPFDAERVDIAKLIVKCAGFAAVENEKVIGAIGGLVHPNPFNSRVEMLTELFFFVKKEYRNGTIGGRLLLNFIQMGEDMGSSISMSTIDSTPDSMRKFLSNRGFIQKERSWTKWAQP